MSEEAEEIVCRRCQEEIPVGSGNCPHCGASIRSSRVMIAVIAFGAVLAVSSLFNIGDLLIYGVIGVIMMLIGGYLLYDKRQRIDEASQTVESAFASDEE